ncbi:MAG: penicillin-binding protein 2 [Calditrichia bacterium]
MISRKMVFYIVVIIPFLILSAGFFNLQVLQESVYRQKSRKNSVKIEMQTPVRGLIYDRNGILIADNRPAFSLYLVPAEAAKNTNVVPFVAKVLGMSEKEIRKNFRHSRRFQPVKVARYVDQTTLTLIQENKSDLPGVEWRVEPRRNYNFRKSFSHVLGTLGEVTEKELGDESVYQPGDIVGKKGVERVLDRRLRGKKGYKLVKVDALGRTVDEIPSEKNSFPYPGQDLYLTIDSRLQIYADSLLRERIGAIVAIDTRKGEILTIVSNPNFDLNDFTGITSPEIWSSLLNDSRKPMFDRASQATYPPGSTYKMIAAIAALNEGLVTPQWSAYCPGYWPWGRGAMRCWNPAGHGEVNMVSAIRGSCNVFFYYLGNKVGIEDMTSYAKMMGFGKPTGVELTSERKGFIPDRAYYERVYGKDKISKGMLANIAIGQGEVLSTPLQMAQFAMILANRGSFVPPHLTNRLVNKVTLETQTTRLEHKKMPTVRSEVWDVVCEGMRQVVAGGTGWRAGIWKIDSAGKTGTAQNPHGKPHSWYMGFAPFENPEVAIAIVLENGGGGGAMAAPLAGQYLRRYFAYEGKFSYEEERDMQRILNKRRQEQALKNNLQELQQRMEADTSVRIR